MLWAIITKIQSESKSQPGILHTQYSQSCEQSLRRYNLKANHNVGVNEVKLSLVVSNHYEDTIWKQITTCLFYFCGSNVLWAIITKIQSESKSQRTIQDNNNQMSCEQSLRRYNLKANHNWILAGLLVVSVVSNHYEDTIWKQITTPPSFHQLIQGCEQSLRRYNLKANHN